MRTRLDFIQMYWSREARRTYIYTHIRNTRCPIGLFVCIHASMHTYAKYLCPEHKVHTLVGWGWSGYSCPEYKVHTLVGWGWSGYSCPEHKVLHTLVGWVNDRCLYIGIKHSQLHDRPVWQVRHYWILERAPTSYYAQTCRKWWVTTWWCKTTDAVADAGTFSQKLFVNERTYLFNINESRPLWNMPAIYRI